MRDRDTDRQTRRDRENVVNKSTVENCRKRERERERERERDRERKRERERERDRETETEGEVQRQRQRAIKEGTYVVCYGS